MGSGGSFVSAQHDLCEPDEGVPLWRCPQEADLSDGFFTVALGQEDGLLHTVTLKHNNRCSWEFMAHFIFCSK